jgi:hypothetical protein
VRVHPDRFHKAVGECSQRKIGDNCRVTGDWVSLCIFDEGFLLGFEEGFEEGSKQTAGVATTIILIPGTVRDN